METRLIERLAREGRIHISKVTVVEMNTLRQLSKRQAARVVFADGFYCWAGMS